MNSDQYISQITIHRSDRVARNKKNIASTSNVRCDSTIPSRTELASVRLDPGKFESIPFGFYLHIPFCFHKCHYCDFYSIVDSRGRQKAFTDRLIQEIECVGSLLSRRPQTVFIGGGTPTLLETSLLENLLEVVRQHLIGDGTCEITVEANPETITAELARTLAAGGVNRVSIGAQTFNPGHLKTLERWHDPANVGRAVDHFRAAGIENINLDLIFAIPGQTVAEWRDDLDRATELLPTHLSCYGLMYEPNTPLTRQMQRGRIMPIADDDEAAMYELTMELLADRGFEQYEVSAWARPGRRCEHNLIYWRNHDWWPLGPSASGHVAGVRWKNIARLADYLSSDGLPPTSDVEQLDVDSQVGETLMLGLRLLDGLPLEQINDLLSLGRRGPERAVAIDGHVAAGLLVRQDGRLRLTRRGLLLADSVISDLI